MKIVATQGANRYLLVEDNINKLENDTKSRVLDLNQQKLFPWFNLQSILARGYWKNYNGNQDILENLLSQVKEVGD